jgi:hypothetical protein
VVVVDFVNAFGFVPLHVLKPAMRINVSINMLFGTAACYSRESAPAMPITSGATTVINLFALEIPPRKSMRSIADNLSKGGWSLGCVSAVDSAISNAVGLTGSVTCFRNQPLHFTGVAAFCLTRATFTVL